MFSEGYSQLWSEVAAQAVLEEQEACRIAREASPGDLSLASLLFAKGFGKGGELDQILLARSAEVKASRFNRTVQAVAPLYVSSICNEHCHYCNYRAENRGESVVRVRLRDEELRQEAEFLIREKGLHCLELVYASDPAMRGAVMRRHVEMVRNLLEKYGGGAVGLSAEALEEHEYRDLLHAGLSFCVLWQETYHRERYEELHPGRGAKSGFLYRLDAFERMLAAGIRDVGIGVLTGLSPWKRDWAMLMRHEAWLREHCGHGPMILGIPRLKPAPGALMHESPFTPTDQEFLAVVALHNLLYPEVRPFVSTREPFELCVELARGGGCLFTFNCSTIPGGYTLHKPGFQFPSGSYDAPVYSRKLAELGLTTDWNWAWYEERLYGQASVGV